MKSIWERKTVRNFAWLLVPATLGFYQSKLNSMQSFLKYEEHNNTIDEAINVEVMLDIITLKVIGYIAFFIAMVLYFKFVWGNSHT